MNHADAPAGKALKYARPELERRFLLACVAADPPVRSVRIFDRYLSGTRIRLREIRDVTESVPEVMYKLTQKIPTADGRPGLITTMYLSADEHATLARLPADCLEKVRHRTPPFGVDVFEGQLSGLILAEAEFVSRDEMTRFEPPIPVVAEVTTDRRLAGGTLARTSSVELARVLATYGLAADR